MQFRTLPAVGRIAATYAGTLIGAGFASGQEIAQFFVSYGPSGIMGILVASVMFAFLGARLLELGFRLKATAYHQVIYYLCGRRIGLLLDIVTAIFLFAGLAIMLAGAATVFRDYCQIPYATGLVAAGLLVVATVLFGVRGIASANIIVTPILVVSITLICIYSLFYHRLDTAIAIPGPAVNPPAPHWLLSALLYVSYNLTIVSTVLVPLGSSVPSRRIRFWGGIAGGLTLGCLATFLAVIIMLHHPQLLHYEVPILQLASAQHAWGSFPYTIALLAAMYTTAIASLYGCATKIEATTGLRPVVSVVAITLLAMLCSQLGFANLIKLLFPLFGYATLYFTGRLIWTWLRGS